MLLVNEHAKAAGELPIAVRHEFDVFNPKAFRPLVHDKGIVDADAENLIDAELAEGAVQRVVSRTLFVRASRREGAGERENHDALAGEESLARYVLPAKGIGSTDA